MAERLPEAASEADWLLLRPNLERVSDFAIWFEIVGGEIEAPDLAHDERLMMREAAAVAEEIDWTASPWATLTGALKERTGRKGRELFHPLRLALTGRDSGPEMAGLLERIGKDRAIRRFDAAARR